MVNLRAASSAQRRKCCVIPIIYEQGRFDTNRPCVLYDDVLQSAAFILLFR